MEGKSEKLNGKQALNYISLWHEHFVYDMSQSENWGEETIQRHVQAYQQIRAILIEYEKRKFIEENDVQKESAKMTEYELRTEVIKLRAKVNRLEQRTVGRDWIEKKAEQLVNRFHGEVNLSELQYIGILTVLTEKGDLEDILQELGIKVKEKK